MDFLKMMNILFDLQEKFPDFRWDLGEEGMEKTQMSLHITISNENAKLLRDATQMFGG